MTENNQSKPDKVFVVMTVARQVDGEYVFVRSEKGFFQAGKADKLMQKLKSDFVDEKGNPKPVKLITAQGEALCMCEVGAFEVEIAE